MEDAATAEIARSQVWQWVHNDAKLSDGRVVTPELVHQIEDEELEKIRRAMGDAYPADRAKYARELFEEVALADEFDEFLTLPAYERLD
jgi:malate synthase